MGTECPIVGNPNVGSWLVGSENIKKHNQSQIALLREKANAFVLYTEELKAELQKGDL